MIDDNDSSAIRGCGKGIISTAQLAVINIEAELRHDMFTARDLGMSLEQFRALPGRKAGKLGFDPADYGGMTTLQRMKAARRWLLWKSVPNADPNKKPRKVPFYTTGQPRNGKTDTPEDVAQFATYGEAKAALVADATMTGLGFALGLDEETGDRWQGADFDGSMNGIEKAPGYVEKSPSGNGYHAIGRGDHFKAHPTGDGFEAYCEKRYFTFTGLVENDGPLVDLTKTGLRKFIKPAAENGEQYANGHDKGADTGTAANPLQAYIDAGSIPAGECDNVLTQFWGHAVRAVKLGHATVEQAALFMGRVNSRLAENKDKEFQGKFKRLLQNEGLTLAINVGKYQTFDDGNPIQLLGPKLSQADEAGLQYITKNRIVLGGERRAPEFVLQNIMLAGVTAVVGYTAVGKTTSLLAIMLHVAGLLQMEGLPVSIRRQILYLTEDYEQLERTIESWQRKGIITKSWEEINEWFIPVRAKRRKPDEWKLTIQEFILVEAAKHEGKKWWPVPVVVFDTGASTFDIKKIEDNAEISQFIADLKDAAHLAAWPNLTVSILPVLHVAKHQRNSTAEEITALGGQAWTADTKGTLIFLVDPDTGQRLMALGKKRFEINEDIKHWVINSELLPPVKLTTDWGEEYPELAVYESTSRCVTSFEPKTNTAVKDAKEVRRLDEAFKEVNKKFREKMEEARAAGKLGLTFYLPPKRSGTRPDEYLPCSWKEDIDIRNSRGKGKGEDTTDKDNEKLRGRLMRKYKVEHLGTGDAHFILLFKLSVFDAIPNLDVLEVYEDPQ